ncbi:hypothetical protein Emed_002952 [Eimeria media]
MTAFGSLHSINVASCTTDETAQKFGIKTSLKKARYFDEDSKSAFTVLSISVANDGCFFIEALFLAVLNKRRETRSILNNLRKLMPNICSKRREQHGGGLKHQKPFNKFAQNFSFSEVLRELVECPCNFIVVNPSAAEKSREVMEKASIRCRLFTELNLAIKIQDSQAPLNAAEREQQQHQQQPAAAAPRLSLLDKEQEEEEFAVSQRQLLQLRAQQAFELSSSRQKSQQQSESAQQSDTKASSIFPPWKASYHVGSTQATESEAWHTLQAE